MSQLRASRAACRSPPAQVIFLLLASHSHPEPRWLAASSDKPKLAACAVASRETVAQLKHWQAASKSKMNFFSSPSAGITWEKLESLDNVPQELKDEAKSQRDLHIDFQDPSGYPHYCIVQFQIDGDELRGYCNADRLKAVVLPRLAADNVRPLIVIKKPSPSADFRFLAVCDGPVVDEASDNSDDDSQDSDVESPKSPVQSRAASASKRH